MLSCFIVLQELYFSLSGCIFLLYLLLFINGFYISVFLLHLFCSFLLSSFFSSYLCFFFSWFFFFQSKDGIRDAHYGLEFRRVLFRSARPCAHHANRLVPGRAYQDRSLLPGAAAAGPAAQSEAQVPRSREHHPPLIEGVRSAPQQDRPPSLRPGRARRGGQRSALGRADGLHAAGPRGAVGGVCEAAQAGNPDRRPRRALPALHGDPRSEEHTSELQSLMRISYA